MIDIGKYFAEHGGDTSLFMFLWKGDTKDDTKLQLSTDLSDKPLSETARTEQWDNMGARD